MFYVSPTGNTILEKSNDFLYEKCIYIFYPDRVELYSEEYIRMKKPISKKYLSKYIKKKGYSILLTLEWIGAPSSFLLSNEFTILDNNEYKENIKQLSKKKKK